MVQFIKHFIAIILLLFISYSGFAHVKPENNIAIVLNELEQETKAVTSRYDFKNIGLQKRLVVLNKKLAKTNNANQQVALLIQKDQLKEQLNLNALSEASDISKIRYLKGLQIIKILYEKTLSLDHHFSSVATFNEINNLSNPNHYPEFAKMKDVISSKQDKKEGFNLSNILGDNIYTSVVHSIVSLFTNTSSSKAEKEANLEDVECILDFTLRMHNDLNTIYFETAFLQKSNDNIIKELEQLFVDFTKPIQYKTPLKECRNADDWDAVRGSLNGFLEELNKVINDETQRYKAHKMQINLEFPIDRLLQFITQYNSHINQGAKFYEKFGIMLNSYENEQQCASKIPTEYKTLKENIKTSIEKFNTAYKPVEINGSKMKQVLYGINEYD
ncbi:hypothetical protein Q4512_05505 [Oceanihabitans sp. 2_MG-2023]|uniref:hypothetical protein n=1 Tax=Oceanihabitans sp. 2_MG-2023 TaxID=3062661 RepID=UPI0026E16597|nr:hypothetical protein [Oceanihabitans sp. 2_MG-2023]MDO6596361.1 hypothetical protein [Oceanihabitans sp. 2_MG-2023]